MFFPPITLIIYICGPNRQNSGQIWETGKLIVTDAFIVSTVTETSRSSKTRREKLCDFQLLKN